MASATSHRALPSFDEVLAAIPDRTGQVQTVLGLVAPGELGMTLMHEHVLLDIRRPAHAGRPGEDDAAAAEELTLSNLAAVRRGRPNEDNDILGDFDLMLEEVGAFVRQGGGSIVEVSNVGLGRDAKQLAELSRASGLHLVMGAGYYQLGLQSEEFESLTVEQMTERIVRDLVTGVAAEGSGLALRAGIIGEIGAEGDPVHPAEMRSIRAAGRASALTGAPITLHHGGFGEEKLRVLDALEAEGADPRSVIFGHTGSIGDDPRLAERLLIRGVFVEADFLGTTGSPWGTLFPFTDRSVARGFASLIASGWGEQLVVGTDVCQRIQLSRYGGHGYGYVVDHFLPTLEEFGASAADLTRIMVENPAKALAFRAPQGR